MTAVQVADGVWRIPTTPADFINSYLLQGADGTLTLVDAGTALRARRRSSPRCPRSGFAPGDVTHLLLSHAHNDHTGGARAVVDATGAQVQTHEREAVYVREGRMPQVDTSTRGGRLMARLPGRATGFAKVGVDGTFERRRRAAAGRRHPGRPHARATRPATAPSCTRPAGCSSPPTRSSTCAGCATRSRAAAPTSGSPGSRPQRLGELDFEVAGFTHGEHVSTGARAAVRAFLAGRPS